MEFRNGISRIALFFSILILALIAVSCAPAAPAITSPTAAPPAVISPTPAPPTQAPVATKAPAATSAPATSVPAATAPAAASTASGKMTVGMSGDITDSDPQLTLLSLDQSILFPNLYDSLLWYNFKGEKQPRLLTEWKNLSDTEWQFKLRQGVTFQNGEPWNAKALVWNWTRKLESGKPRHATLENLAKQKIEIIDDYTVKVTTTQPYPTLLDDMAILFVLPPDYVQKVGDAGFAKSPVGTGAFKFVEWVKGDHLTLEANPTYWGGAPKIKTLILKPIPEVATRVAALKTGEVDMILAVPPDQADGIKSDPKLSIVTAPINGVVYIEEFVDSPQGGGKPLADQKVRQALNYAVNVDNIIQFLLHGYAKRAASIVNSLAFGFDPTLTPYPYDPDMAKKLLADAGYANGFTINFDLASLGLPNDVQVMQAVIADWAKVGINVKVNQMDSSAIVPLKLGFKIAPLFYWTFRGFDADYIAYLQAHSGQVWFFYPGWTPELDKLLDDQHNTVDQQKRLGIWKQIQARFKEDAPYVTLYEPMTVYGLNKRVSGFEPQPKDTVSLATVSISQ